VLREQAEKTAASEEQARQLLGTKQREFEQTIVRLQSENNILRTPQTPRTSLPHPTVTVQDTLGVATVGRDVVVNTPGEPGSTFSLPAALSGTVKELVTVGSVTTVKPAQDALASIRDETKSRTTRGSGGGGTIRPIPRSPSFTAVRATGPTMRWTPVPDALSYEVTVVSYRKGKDEVLKSWHQNTKTQTQWTWEPGTFVPGEIYLWEVTAEVPVENGQTEVVGSPTAGFWVLDGQALRSVEAAERDYGSSALVLSGVYAKYGLYEESLTQLKRLEKLNPNSRFVGAMLRRLLKQLNRSN
jgi:hypothetical protein